MAQVVHRTFAASDLDSLRDRIRTVEVRAHVSMAPVPTGWDGFPALSRGTLHEWFGLEDGRAWIPPHMILAHLALQALSALGPQAWCVWIGSRLWPRAHALRRAGVSLASLLSRSLVVDAASPGDRLMAVDAALRMPGLVVVADASGFDMASSRRLQIAAEAGESLGLLARPPRETGCLSVAGTRSRVSSEVSTTSNPRFRVELLRAKGPRRGGTYPSTTIVERTDGGAIVAVPANLRMRSPEAAAAS